MLSPDALGAPGGGSFNPRKDGPLIAGEDGGGGAGTVARGASTVRVGRAVLAAGEGGATGVVGRCG